MKRAEKERVRREEEEREGDKRRRKGRKRSKRRGEEVTYGYKYTLQVSIFPEGLVKVWIVFLPC